MYEELDRPYGDELLARYGGGLRHVCGPHPSAGLYMTEEPATYGLNCSWRFSRNELPRLREALGPQAEERLGRRGHLEVMFERDMAPDYVVESFRRLADELAPDVLALPYCQVSAKAMSDEEVAGALHARSAPRRPGLRLPDALGHVNVLRQSGARATALRGALSLAARHEAGARGLLHR